MLVSAARVLSQGNGVVVRAVADEVSIHEAADLLSAAPSFVTALAERGEILFHRVADRLRLALRDVIARKARRDQQSEDALRDLARLGQEHGLYDE